jgi:hypothetical protein
LNARETSIYVEHKSRKPLQKKSQLQVELGHIPIARAFCRPKPLAALGAFELIEIGAADSVPEPREL